MAKGTTTFGDYMSLGQVETLKNNCTKVRWEENGGDFSDGIGNVVPAKVKNGSTKPLSKRELKLEIQRLKNQGYNTTHIECKAFPLSKGERLLTEIVGVEAVFLFPNEIKRFGDVNRFYYSKNEEEFSRVFNVVDQMGWGIE